MFDAIQILRGGKKLIAQWNEKWTVNFLAEFENNTPQPFEPSKPSHMKILRENLLFCVARGEKEGSELIPSTALPKGGTLVVLNVSVGCVILLLIIEVDVEVFSFNF